MSRLTAVNLEAAPPRKQRPRLLVSVQDIGEAEAALAGGADWIDLKQPTAGPLGPVSTETAREVVNFVASHRPVSAALGELVDWACSPARGLLDIPEIGAVKLGLSGCAAFDGWQTDWLQAEADVLMAEKSLVAVVYADWQQARAPAPEAVLELAVQSTCHYVLIDTFDKRSSGTIERLGIGELRRILNIARRQSLRTVVAGGIKLFELSQLPKDSIDLVAVRGAVCPHDRDGPIDRQLVTGYRQALLEHRET